jgi:hypothetical protein
VTVAEAEARIVELQTEISYLKRFVRAGGMRICECCGKEYLPQRLRSDLHYCSGVCGRRIATRRYNMRLKRLRQIAAERQEVIA